MLESKIAAAPKVCSGPVFDVADLVWKNGDQRGVERFNTLYQGLVASPIPRSGSSLRSRAVASAVRACEPQCYHPICGERPADAAGVEPFNTRAVALCFMAARRSSEEVEGLKAVHAMLGAVATTHRRPALSAVTHRVRPGSVQSPALLNRSTPQAEGAN